MNKYKDFETRPLTASSSRDALSPRVKTPNSRVVFSKTARPATAVNIVRQN